jgi:hypothetical protein
MGGAHHRQLGFVGLDPERRQPGGHEPFEISAVGHEANPTAGPWALGCNRAPVWGIGAPNQAQSARNPRSKPVLKAQIVPQSHIQSPGRTASLAVAAGVVGLLLVLAVALLPTAAGGAPRKTVVLGETQDTPRPACPRSPCEAVGSVTGFQARAGAVSKPHVVPFNGRLVAWSISLSKPKASQQSFFNDFYGSPPQARIGVVRQVPNKKPPRYELLRQTPTVTLTRFLGSNVTFALDEPLVVRQGDIVALTIPTWAPAFAVGLADSSGWRASRKAGECMQTADIKESRPQQKVGSNKQYGCFYKTARLLYTATVVKG